MNNVIEIGNDRPGGPEFFHVGIRPAPEYPADGNTAIFFHEYFDGRTWGRCGESTLGNVSIPKTTVLVVEVEFDKDQAAVSEDGDYFLIDRPDFLPRGIDMHPAYMRRVEGWTSPRPLSHSFGDAKKDWEFLVKKKNEILALEGKPELDEYYRRMVDPSFEGFKKLTDASPDSSKAMKMALYILVRRSIGQHYKNPVTDTRIRALNLDAYLLSAPKSNHYVDVLNGHKHNCGGASGAFAALCAVMGIPVRQVNTASYRKTTAHETVSGHAIAEVRLNGKWHFVENSGGRVARSKCLRPLYPASFQEIVRHPEAFYTETEWAYVELSNGGGAHGASDNARTYGPFNALQTHLSCADMKGGVCRAAFFPLTSALSLAAQYPGEPLLFKVPNKLSTAPDFAVNPLPPVVPLTPTHDKWEKPEELKVEQGQAVRKRFYIPRLDGVQAVRANILFDTAGHVTAGSGWYVRINGKRYELGDPRIGDWVPRGGFAPGIARKGLGACVTFQIPLDDLIPDDGRSTG
ncbi:MAG: transglutaminase domain-containing protein [Kiritimatiellae bacterium]|nr:transglutaminase domain-containing protein [Kiritimatiellia bacterium]